MKKKIFGLILLAAVMAAIGAIYYLRQEAPREIAVDGYLGGEKIGFLEDEEVQKILKDR